MLSLQTEQPDRTAVTDSHPVLHGALSSCILWFLLLMRLWLFLFFFLPLR